MGDIDEEIQRAMERHDFFCSFYQGRTQLEDYGFTSSHTKPDIRLSLQEIQPTHWQTRRIANRTPFLLDGVLHRKVPLLAQVCRESRKLLISSGYRRAFSSFVSRDRTWINLKVDLLVFFRGLTRPPDSFMDDGIYNLQKCPLEERMRVKRLGLLREPNYRYEYGEEVPEDIHETVQMFPDLQELIIIDQDYYTSRKSDGDLPIIVDMDVEELWGHDYANLWSPRLEKHGDQRTSEFLSSMAQYFERQLRNHGHCNLVEQGRIANNPDLKKIWERRMIPKVRFSLLISQDDEDEFMQSRENYRIFIEEMYWERSGLGSLSGIPPRFKDIPGLMAAMNWRNEWFGKARKAIIGGDEMFDGI